MFKKIVFIITGLSFFLNGECQTVLFEESFSDGLPETWSVIDGDELIPATEVEEFITAWIPFMTDLDTCVASTSYYSPTGQSQDYLVSPKIELGTYSRFFWDAKSYDASYPDGYIVLLSTTDSLEASFTNTLKVVNSETPYWNRHSLNLSEAGFANQDVFIAIKNTTNNGYILLIDNILLLGSEFAGIIDNKEAIAINIFPSPAQKYLQVQTKSTILNAQIFALDGRLLLNSNSSELDVSTFESGIYIIRIETEDGIFSRQFTKN